GVDPGRRRAAARRGLARRFGPVGRGGAERCLRWCRRAPAPGPRGPGGPGHGDDLLGAISLSKPPSEPLTGTEDSLLRHLASQASLVMRNAQLTAELRATIDQLLASRRRLVEAQDAERRRTER